LADAEVFSCLNYWAKSTEIQFLVLYCAPQIALANALQEKALSYDECMDLLLSWAKQTRAAYDFFRQHKEQCLLLDIQDVVENQEYAAKEISTFLGHEAKLNTGSLDIAHEAKLSANLLMIEQDEAFELYDEVRSAAPLLGTLKLSGMDDLASFANDALGLVRGKYDEQQRNHKNISTLESSLAVSLEKLRQQKAAHAETSKTHEQQTAQFEKKLADLQAQLLAANKKQENELTAKVALQQTMQQDQASNKQALDVALRNKAELTTQHEASVCEMDKILAEARAEQELQILQLAQLQEELESLYQSNQTLVSQQAIYKATIAEQQQLAFNMASLESENELAILQINQLQEELENSHTKSTAWQNKQVEQLKKVELELAAQQKLVAELRKQHTLAVAGESQKLDSALAENTLFVSEIKQSKSEQELQILQLAQLQEELERFYHSNQTLVSQQAMYKSTIAEQQQLVVSMQPLEAENEIATLQINQLQEELEYYYLQLQEKDTNKMQQIATIERLTQDVFAKCHIDGFDVVGGYEDDGYADIQLLLHGLELANGRQFDNIAVKLIDVDGRPGLEFRPSEDAQSTVPLRWREDMQDEYGAFIKFIPNPTEAQASQQQQTNEILHASERLFIVSIASALANTLQQANLAAGDLQDGKLRDWKLVALRLQKQVANLPAWLSFDGISLIEEMRSDDYEHLWLSFDNLLVNNHLYPNFKVKFAALGPFKEGSLFTDTLIIELREQDNNGAPLQAWPPVAQDEYGFKLQVNIDLQGNDLRLNVDEKLSEHDKQLLQHLAKNLVHFIYALKQQKIVFERSVEDWFSVADRINHLGLSNASVLEPIDTVSEQDLSLQFHEHIDLGGYQHLVYKTDVGKGQSLLFKLRAENINPTTQFADMSLELRTGDANVPLAETLYFGEDDYGPRVLITLSELASDNFTPLELTEGGQMVQIFMARVKKLIENNTALDTQQQRLWLGLLAKEQ